MAENECVKKPQEVSEWEAGKAGKSGHKPVPPGSSEVSGNYREALCLFSLSPSSPLPLLSSSPSLSLTRTGHIDR